MSKVSLAKAILARGVESAEDLALKAASKARDLSDSNSFGIYEKLQSRKNLRLVKDAEESAAKISSDTIAEEAKPRSLFEAPTKKQYDAYMKVRKSDSDANLVKEISAAQDSEKVSRAKVMSGDEGTVAMDEATVALPDKKSGSGNVAAVVAAPTFGGAFANPADIVKKGYEKFEQARSSVVNKIVDLTGAPLLDNPHVPQYAKDTYSKAAESLVDNATNPVNYVGGVGAADAVIGAASTGYDMTQAPKSKQPQVSYPNSNVQQVKYRP